MTKSNAGGVRVERRVRHSPGKRGAMQERPRRTEHEIRRHTYLHEMRELPMFLSRHLSSAKMFQRLAVQHAGHFLQGLMLFLKSSVSQLIAELFVFFDRKQPRIEPSSLESPVDEVEGGRNA